jgi:hypothetical protein
LADLGHTQSYRLNATYQLPSFLLRRAQEILRDATKAAKRRAPALSADVA